MDDKKRLKDLDWVMCIPCLGLSAMAHKLALKMRLEYIHRRSVYFGIEKLDFKSNFNEFNEIASKLKKFAFANYGQNIQIFWGYREPHEMLKNTQDGKNG